MIGFDLTEEQVAIRDMAQKFARTEMMPQAAAFDVSMEYPTKIIEKAHQLGMVSVTVPASAGGAGIPVFDQCLIYEQLAYGCGGMTTAMAANDLALAPLVVAASKEQMDEFARPMVDKPHMAAYCVTEPGAGSDVAGIRTTVKSEGDYYVMNGEKMWITNASKATWYFVLATLDPKLGPKATCGFVIPANLPGIEPGKKEVNLGQRCSDTRGIKFTNVKVHKKYLLGKEGEGFKIAMKAFDHSRPAVAAFAVGLSQCALDHCVRYAKERKAFGRTLAEHQAVAFMIADMAKDIEAGRLLMWKAAWEVDQGRRNSKFASMAKCFSADAAVRITQDAVQIFGGYGYSSEYPVEKLYRDAKIYQIYEGTNQIQRMIISRMVFEEGA